MGEWTKGPWFYVASMTAEESGVAGGQAADVVVEDDDPTENRSAHGISILDDLSDADAQLIAAAPDLYEALNALVVALAGRVHSTPALTALREARRALAQADGREPRDA